MSLWLRGLKVDGRPGEARTLVCANLRAMRIAIIGGGIGGLTTAIALRQSGFDPQVYEQAPQLLDVGAAIALWPNAMRVLTQLGLSQKILEHAGHMKEIRWLDSSGYLLNKVRISDESSSFPAVALHRADLQEVLLEALPTESVHLGCSLVEFTETPQHVNANFTNGLTIETDLLIGADGIHSDVRSRLLNDREPTYRGYMVWRGIANSAPGSLQPQTAIELHGKGKRFGIGPVGQGRVGWWATANAPNTSPKATERNERQIWQSGETVTTTRSKDTQGELLRLFDGWYRPVIQLIESTPSISVLKTGAFDREVTPKWGQGRVTLLGDAIHPTTPNLGQGGCMAIEDAMVLDRVLSEVGPGEEALRVYEQRRLRRTSTITKYSRIYGSVGQWQHPVARGVRRSFLALVPEKVAQRFMQLVFDYDATKADR